MKTVEKKKAPAKEVKKKEPAVKKVVKQNSAGNRGNTPLAR
jgi:hypothetical protein